MNNVAILDKISMKLLQSQNIKRNIVKQVDPSRPAGIHGAGLHGTGPGIPGAINTEPKEEFNSL